MALVVFLRGVNVGGHRRFRPSILARELAAYDVVNVGAAGTLVVRRPGSPEAFVAELRRRLPFEADIAACDGDDLLRLQTESPFGAEPTAPDEVRFVSILLRAGHERPPVPVAIPAGPDWCVRIIEARGQLVCGVYRRRMKTIGYLGQLDKIFGDPATTRTWNTITSVVRILRSS